MIGHLGISSTSSSRASPMGDGGVDYRHFITGAQYLEADQASTLKCGAVVPGCQCITP